MDVRVPPFPESVQEGTLSRWYRKPGEHVAAGEKIADIETDKIVIEVTAGVAGKLGRILKTEGATVKSNEVIAAIGDGAGGQSAPVPAKAAPAPPPAPKPAAAPRVQEPPASATAPDAGADDVPSLDTDLGPAVRKLIEEHHLNPAEIASSGRGGRITKADVLRHLEHSPHLARKYGAGSTPPPPVPAPAAAPVEDRPIQRVKMTRIRQRIAERLVEAQRSAAILTTFNEINMQGVMNLRNRYKETFEKEHGIKLGFMSFFVKATVEALTKYPIVNASLEGDEILYHGYFDIGIAVASDRGLVVPVVRDAQNMSLAEIELKIADFAARAKDSRLTMDELAGGTFTITNGGVFGSILSTPILNPPQSAILGMHRIEERPVAEDGQVVIRPMMYTALSYDHRLIDGRDAVMFLVAIKDAIEDPSRLLLQI
jgi:2-oxoglutarate dehydrogenase E2 component (dihydrolipoamide succinyltransferase)